MNKTRKNSLKINFAIVLITFLLLVLFGEMYVNFNGKVKNITPYLLKERSIEYTPSIFARYVFPQKEQKLIDMYSWLPQTRRQSNDTNWQTHPNRHINQQGYRGKPFNINKNPDTIRVIIYGGSAVFDIGAPEKKDWPHRVEQYLHKEGFTNVEVINAGIPGHASFDSFGRLFAEGHLFKPDFVILYNSWNDIKRFPSDQFLLREIKPHVAKSNPMLYAQNRLDQFLINRSLLYIALRQNYLNWKLKVGPEGAAKRKYVDYKLNQKALDQFQLNIELFIDCARNIGAEPIIMTQGRLIGPNNEKDHPYRLRHVTNFMPFDFSHTAYVKADEIIRKVAKQKNTHFIDAANLLLEGNKEIFYDHVHLKDYGSDVISKIVGNKIKELILSEQYPNDASH